VAHRLLFGRPVPGALATSEGYRLAWEGARVMGILNVTPDSFSDGGRFFAQEAAVAQGERLLAEGAFILDLGGESTRPGAEPVPAETELDRVLPVLRRLAHLPVLLSVDTRKPEVAAAALSAGAHLVNDVTALADPEMAAVCRDFGAPAVLMHMQGEPQTMQEAPCYQNVVAEVATFLRERAASVLASGVPSVVVDPGFGFGKSLEHNLELVRHFGAFAALGHPAMLGASRKASIGKLADAPDPEARVPGSTALHLAAAQQGAALVRVHDVAAHVQALRVWEAVWATQ
jgi:dihydropteroate synthase